MKNLQLIPNYTKQQFIKNLNDLLLPLISTEKSYKIQYFMKTSYGYLDFTDQMEDQYCWSLNAIYDDDYKQKLYNGEIRNEFKGYSLVHSDIFKALALNLNPYVEEVSNILNLSLSNNNEDCDYIIIKISIYKSKNYKFRKLQLTNKRLFSTSQVLSFASTSDYRLNTEFKTDNWKFDYASDIEGNLKDIFSRYLQEGMFHTVELFSEHTTATDAERLNIDIFDNDLDINGDGLDAYVNLLAGAIHKHVSSLKDYLDEPIKSIHIVVLVTHNNPEDI